jgi:hypothetical protein
MALVNIKKNYNSEIEMITVLLQLPVYFISHFRLTLSVMDYTGVS